MLPQKRRLQKYLPYFLAGALLLILLIMAKSEKMVLRSASRVQQEQEDITKYFFVPTWARNVSEVKEQDYHDLRHFFLIQYAVEVYRSTGKPLELPDDWANPYFAGASQITENSAQVLLWGGLARAPGATSPIIAAVICHELGHLLGGEPRQSKPLPEWSSSEGQSDFYAATRCLPDYFAKNPQVKMSIETEVRELCHGDERCEKVTQVGLDLIRFLQKYSYREFTPVSVLKQEAPAAELNRNRYPSDQCRLDTFVQAAQCSSSEICRPAACWFK